MDGILNFGSPNRALHHRATVPLVAIDSRNAVVRFADYPRLFHLLDSDGNPAVTLRVAPRLPAVFQAWLFFGLLAEFFQQQVNPLDFVLDGAVDLNRDESHAYFSNWAARIASMSQDEREAELSRIVTLLEVAFFSVDAYDCPSYESQTLDRVALSIKMLINLLLRVAEEICSPAFVPSNSNWQWSWAGYAVHGFGVTSRNDRLTRLRTQPTKARSHLAGAVRECKPLHGVADHDANGGPCRAARYLLVLFSEAGWCSHQSRNACLSYDYLAANMLASFGPGPDSSPERHRGCLAHPRCVALNTSEENYPYWHVDDDGCSPIKVSRAEVSRIINEGGVPIISISAHADDLDLKVIKCTPWTTYTAISHVWSDGLGNPNDNSLFACQLYRLRSMIRECFDPDYSPFFNPEGTPGGWRRKLRWYLHKMNQAGRPLRIRDKSRIYFWIDTLCIPVATADDDAAARMEVRQTKKKAIKQISPIYAGASEVLVLDRGLDSLERRPGVTLDAWECAAIILTSNWAQRGWTLEEGSISQSCVVRIAGKPYELDLLTSESNSEKLPPHITSPLWKVWGGFHNSFATYLGRELGEEKRILTTMRTLGRGYLENWLRIPHFVRVWNSLIARSTTRPEDAVIILANLLDFNITRLLQVPEDDRLPLVIKSCAEIPFSLMFAVDMRECLAFPLKNSWIPLRIEPVRLTGGAFWKATKPSAEGGTYTLHFQDCLPDHFLVFVTDHLITREALVFSLSHGEKTFYVKSKASRCSDETVTQAEPRAQQSLVIIDLAAGSKGRGFIGMGARFEVLRMTPTLVVVSFVASIEAYSTEQWRLCATELENPTEYFTSATLSDGQTVRLQIGE